MKRFIEWIKKYQAFLNEVTIDEHGNKRPTHVRIIKVEMSLFKLIIENTLFTYLDEELVQDISSPSTNNRIEWGLIHGLEKC